MLRTILGGLACLGLAIGLFSHSAVSQNQNQNIEPRIAFVVGNSAYEKRPVENALNDAGLVAEALRSIGFQIVEGADLGQSDFLRSYREFLDKVEAAGPDAIAFVYFSGYGLAFEGENFLVSVDARLDRESDIPLQTLRLSDLLRPLAGSPARAKVFAIDAARPLPFTFRDAPLARGLGAIEAPQGTLIGLSAAPGTVAEDPAPPNYGAYATALAEMLRAPGLDLDGLFIRARTRVHQLTEGRQTPWHVTGLTDAVLLVAGDVRPDASVSAPPPPPRFERETRPMREIGPDEAYAMAIELDTLDGYTEFVESYPRHAYSPRVYAIIRARREALSWLRARQINTPESYWTYLRRYPDGLYAPDAHRRLRRLAAAFAPPPGFAPIEFYDVPPPLADEPVEYVYIERYAGPPPPRILIAPPPAFFLRLSAPERRGPPRGERFRGLPATVSIPVIQQVAPARRPDFDRSRRRQQQQQPAGQGQPASAPASASVAPASVAPAQPGVPDSRRRPGRPPLQASTPPASQPAPATKPAPAAPSATAPAQPDSGRGRPGDPDRRGPPAPDRRGPPPAVAIPPSSTPPAASVPSTAPSTSVAPSPTDPRRLPPPEQRRLPQPPASATAPGSTPPSATPSPSDRRLPPPEQRRLPQPPASATAPSLTPPSSATPSPSDPRRLPPPEQRRLPQPPASATAPTSTPPSSAVPPAADPRRGPPPELRRGPPPELERRPPPGPPPAARTAPPSAPPPSQATPPARVAPPPPPAARPAPPPTASAPPPSRPAAPPPPPPAARPAPPPPPAARPAPPPPPAAAAKPAAPAAKPAGKKCEVKDGKEVCK